MLRGYIFFTNFANMIEIDRHIEYLLLSNDCVIVPDFGGFMAHHVDAHYDESDDMFLPPTRTIGFNPQLKLNDSLLVQSYIEAYDISYPEALALISDEVAEIRQHLENNGSYEMLNLGTLILNENGNYVFEPCEAGIMTPELYGMSGFTMARLSKVCNAASETIALNPEFCTSVSDTETSIASTPVRSIFDNEDEEEHNEFFLVRKSWVRNVVAVCIALIAFYVSSTPLSSPQHQQSLVDTGLLSKIVPQEVVNNVTASQVETGVDTDAKTLEIKDSHVGTSTNGTEEALEISKPYYSIVLASRVTKRNAANYVETLQHQGFEDARVLITSNNVKVIYGTYNTEAQAYNALNKLHGNEPFREGWITKVKE